MIGFKFMVSKSSFYRDQYIIWTAGYFSPNFLHIQGEIDVEFRYNFVMFRYFIIDYRQKIAFSRIPLQCDKRNNSIFYDARDIERLFIPSDVTSVFLSSSTLILFIYLAQVKCLHASSDMRLFFFPIELFKIKFSIFLQLGLSQSTATPSSVISQSSSLSSMRESQYLDIEIDLRVSSVIFLQLFMDRLRWVKCALLSDLMSIFIPLSQIEVSCRSSFVIFLRISLQARKINPSDDISELPYRTSSQSFRKFEFLEISLKDSSVNELSAKLSILMFLSALA